MWKGYWLLQIFRAHYQPYSLQKLNVVQSLKAVELTKMSYQNNLYDIT
jgi:hypothetical protein